MEKHEFDVVVVGKGNAALCAALSAKDQGAKVGMLEAASEDEHGGNSRFAGAGPCSPSPPRCTSTVSGPARQPSTAAGITPCPSVQ